jgi:hypothetical protein
MRESSVITRVRSRLVPDMNTHHLIRRKGGSQFKDNPSLRVIAADSFSLREHGRIPIMNSM